MPQVTVKLYRLLHRVRKDYAKAQIPFVGIMGFEVPPVLDPRNQLSNAFRSTAVTNAVLTGWQESDGFRALRQAQQQLKILTNTDEGTREALQGWFQLCESWARRRHGSRDASAKADADGDMHREGSDARIDGNRTMLAADLSQLAAALEEGALLVDRLYEANHLSLEEFDTEDGQGEESAADSACDGVDQAASSGSDRVRDDLPAPLLIPSVLAIRRQLDDLAATVAASHPELFPYLAVGDRVGDGDICSGGGGPNSGGAGRSDTAVLRQQLEAISQVRPMPVGRTPPVIPCVYLYMPYHPCRPASWLFIRVSSFEEAVKPTERADPTRLWGVHFHPHAR
ncbi:hypothetical protein Vretimale_13717 [Volvox reticuliferus]|uniref:Uncharacterized protein n=1 Tax=Volvox reticuliferus TaxID=1737510 RepID=A0A8J4CT94_9CHLO|nr:hypothetical protein Vretifemale_14692 [Volvox reticuliferus]GIM09928.1 hypothetical protein Vretimale_13717 [Volvox reticuliferus]